VIKVIAFVLHPPVGDRWHFQGRDFTVAELRNGILYVEEAANKVAYPLSSILAFEPEGWPTPRSS
jgi:hypothetical protein